MIAIILLVITVLDSCFDPSLLTTILRTQQFTGQIEKPWPETPTHSLEEIVESVRLRASPMFGWNSASEGAWVTFVQSVLMTVHNVVEEESENGIQRRLNIYQLQ